MVVENGMDQYYSKIRDCFGDDEYSSAQYYSKTLSLQLRKTDHSSEDTQDKRYMYSALQCELILEEYETEDHACCDETYANSFLNWENHKDLCGAMIDIDR